MDWIDELFEEVESYDGDPRLRDYCFNIWDQTKFCERMEEYEYYSRIECADRSELVELLRELLDRQPEKVRSGMATQKEIIKFINDRI